MLLAALRWQDWLIVGAYGLAVLVVGLLVGAKGATTSEFTLAERKMPWFLLGVSLIASSFSSISFLNLTGWGFDGGMSWIQLWVGELAAAAIISSLFLPYFSRKKFTTAYEFLGHRFGAVAWKVASGVFHLTMLGRTALLLLLTARALSVLTDLHLYTAIVCVGATSTTYSILGGLRAVIWTDLMQMTIVFLGLGSCYYVILSHVPIAENAMAATSMPDATALSMAVHPTLLSSILGYGVLVLSVAATNQQAVQRYLACSDLSRARRALFLAWGLGVIAAATTLGIGVLIRTHLGPDFAPPSQAFVTFLTTHVPIGLAGLLTAAVFAAAMSSTDSAVHSLATATLIDFIPRRRRAAPGGGGHAALARWLTMLYGVVAMGLAAVASRDPRDVLTQLLDWFGLLGGPVLGLFLLAALTRRLTEGPALAGTFAGYVAAVWFRTDWLSLPGAPLHTRLGVHDIWTATVGLVVTLAAAWVVWIGTVFSGGHARGEHAGELRESA